MEEVWKDIEGITGYLVSNMGRVKSIKSKKQVIRSLSDDKDGYKILWMPNGKGGDTSARVHRLVAKAFVPNPKKILLSITRIILNMIIAQRTLNG